MHILNREIIEDLLDSLDLFSLISKGFISYSNRQAVVPPVGELSIKNPPGYVHIKYGYIIRDRYYVIKIASVFWKNVNFGILNGQSVILLFDQNTVVPTALLNDEDILKDIRTAVEG